MINNIFRIIQGIVKLRGGSDGTIIGNTSDKLKVTIPDGITASLSDPIHNKPATYSAFGNLKVTQETVLGNYRFSPDIIMEDFFHIEQTNLGRYYLDTGGSALILSTGASADSEIELHSKQIHYYQSGRGLMMKLPVVTFDAGVVGNTREWGMHSPDFSNALYIRLSGTTLSFVIIKNFSETVIPSSSWDIPVTHDGNGHSYYIQFKYYMSGDIYIYRDDILVHTVAYEGTSSENLLDSPDFSIHLMNFNTTNATDVLLKIGSVSIVVEGEGLARRLAETPDDESIAGLTKAVLFGKTDKKMSNSVNYNSARVNDDDELLTMARLQPLQFAAIVRLLEKNNVLLEKLNVQLYSITGIKGD